MELKNEKDILSSYNAKEHVGDRKAQKFFRITIPILVIEIIAVIGLGIYYFILPKNYCKISTNVQDSVIYVNNKEAKQFRMNNPNSKTDYYFYSVDVSILLPGDETYSVDYTLKCDKYEISATTSASKTNNVYNMTIVGGKKTQLLSAITIKSTNLIKNFNVSIEINAEKM